MAPDDRDRNFEKALARHLRSSGSPGADSSALGGASREACPDPEILAAYHDGSLTAEERILWKQHVVGCENCQLVLAHLETPLEVPVNTASNVPVPAKLRAAASVAAASPVSIVRPRRPPSMRWLWLVPAGATAAGLVAWISLHQQKTMQVAPPPVEVAENRQEPAAAAPPASRSAQPERMAPPRSKELERKDFDRSDLYRKEKDQPADHAAGAATPAPNRDAREQQLNNRVQQAQQAPNQNAAAPAHGPSLSQQKQQQQMASGGAAGLVGGRNLDQKKADASASLKAEERAKQQPAAPQPPPPGEPGFLADETVSPPPAQKSAPPPKPVPAQANTATGAATKSGVTSTDAVSSMSETVEVTSGAPSLKKMRVAVLQDSHVFSAPDKKHLWSIGPAGWLEFSKNKGEKWTAQFSGVSTDLTAGSAPSAKICWVVGRSGTILRTTDAGDHWTRLDSPESGDLAGVTASDDLHARISFAPDPQTGLIRTYETTDGGATWSLVPNE